MIITIIKWLCIFVLFFGPIGKRLLAMGIVSTRPYYRKSVMGVRTYYPYDIQVQEDRVSFMIGARSSGVTFTDFSYEVVDRELRITLYGRLADPPIDKTLNDYLSSITILIQKNTYDRISINDDETTMIIYEIE